jgi:hypothetical protein
MWKMKRDVFIGLALLLSFLLVSGVAYAQQQSMPGMQTQQNPAAQQDNPQGQSGGWYCPWCGSYQGQCPGMMRGYGIKRGMMQGGQGMGPGMMQGYGMGPDMMQSGQGMGQKYTQQGGKPLTEAQVKTLVKNYVENTGNPNLQVGKIIKTPGKDFYVAEITTETGSLVDKIDVNEYTGWFRSAYAR